jgi:hypothetical protein
MEQTFSFGDVAPPKPREQAVSSREITEYNQAIKNVREAQHLFRCLALNCLAFVESERAHVRGRFVYRRGGNV